MSSRGERRGTYGRLWRKMLIRMLICAVGAGAAVIGLRAVSAGSFADGIVGWIQRYFNLDYESALSVYWRLIPSNLHTIIPAVIVLVFFGGFFFVAFRTFTRYFDEVVGGIDQVAAGGTISLSPELEPVEHKLIQLRQTLELREQEARQAEQEKNDLVMYTAHDIKTPLTSVIGYLTLLDEEPDLPPEKRAKYTRVTLDKARRLDGMMGEFFEITRYNLRNITLKREEVDLRYLLVQLTDEFFPLLEADGKEAALHMDGELTLSGDSEKLARVFNNVLKNAVAYSDPGTTIDIRAERRGEEIQVEVQNRGAPIPPDKLETIFDQFYRLDQARTTRSGGAGLGLAIAREIVTLHGGTISARSTEANTAFTVTLPAEAAG